MLIAALKCCRSDRPSRWQVSCDSVCVLLSSHLQESKDHGGRDALIELRVLYWLLQDAATRRQERLAMRNAVAIKPRASLDGKPLVGHGGPANGSNGRESFHSFFAALDMGSAPMAESNGN